MWTVTKHNLKMFFSHPLGVVILLAPVLLSSFTIGKMFIQQDIIRVGILGIYTEDTSGLDQVLMKGVEEAVVTTRIYDEKEALQDAFLQGDVDVSLCIETTELMASLISQQQVLKLQYREGHSESMAVNYVVEGQVQKLQMLAQLSDGTVADLQAMLDKLATAVDTEVMNVLTMSTVFGIFTLIFLIVVGVSLSPIMREREQKLYDRICLTSIKRYQYLGGHLMGSFCILMVEVLLQTLAFKVMGIDTGLNVAGFILIGAVLTVVGMSISMLILAFTKQTTIYYMVIGIGVTPLCMMSDCLFPIELLPEWVDKISYISPIRWVMKGYKVMLQGNNVKEMLMALGVALVLAAVLILISMVKEQHKIQER